ncbi:MAG: adenine phosphoribosyltransferase [Flavobacteriales bacterium]
METQLIASKIREVKDFPKEGISFKDITPILLDPETSSIVLNTFIERLEGKNIDAIIGVESRGFLFGMMIANALNIPFVPVRKAGKLPSTTISEEYNLEYGSAKLEIHTDSISKGWNVVIHDDLLATGGTAKATSKLVKRLGGNITSFLFLVELDNLHGRVSLENYSKDIISLLNYQT